MDDSRRNFLSIVAYGIHSKYQKDLKQKIEEEFRMKSVFVYEYFLETCVRGQEIKEISGFLPFLLRILNEQNFLPEITNDMPKNSEEIKFTPFNFENLCKFWDFEYKGAIDYLEDTDVSKHIFNSWNERRDIHDTNYWVEYDKNTGIALGNFTLNIEYLREEYLLKIAKLNKVSRIGALKEYMTVVYPWLLCPDIKELNIASISISSQNIFYGDIFIFYPRLAKKGDNIFRKENNGETSIGRELKKWICDNYVPILLLFENYCEEKILSEKLKDEKKINWDEYILLHERLKNSEDEMEEAFHELWVKRKELYETYRPKQEGIKILKDSLLFSKYLIGSPGLMKQIKNLVKSRKFSNKKPPPLSSFLIIGAPGSGKDTMARLVQLFFPNYRFGKQYIINMASLKPSYLSVPIISGGEVELLKTVSKGDYSENEIVDMHFKGIFKKIWESHKRDYPDLDEAKEKGLMPVIILDELNSLDIDAQGSLLRVLQNAEINALGSIEKEDVEFLVVGVVNEPEEILTLEKPLNRFLTESSIFGGVLGKAFYEYFRNMRRLREDLYYRLISDGKITLPNLRDRREDIPLLFAFFIKGDLPEDIGWDYLWFDFDVFERLMDNTLSWSGNFRELQAIVKKTAYYALMDKENRKTYRAIQEGKKPEKSFMILKRHLQLEEKS